MWTQSTANSTILPWSYYNSSYMCVWWSRPWEWISDDTREKTNLQALIPADCLLFWFTTLACSLDWHWLKELMPAKHGWAGWINVVEACGVRGVGKRDDKGKKTKREREREQKRKGRETAISNRLTWPAVKNECEHLPWPNANLVPGLLLMRRDLWVISETNDLVTGNNTLRTRHRAVDMCMHMCVCASVCVHKWVNQWQKEIDIEGDWQKE